jgi:hypothetical protein
VDTGFPKGNATTIESRALSGHDPHDFLVNLIGKRSSLGSPQTAKRSEGAPESPRVSVKPLVEKAFCCEAAGPAGVRPWTRAQSGPPSGIV